MMIFWNKKPIAKSHVKQHERTEPTGQVAVVHEYERADRGHHLHIQDLLDATIRQPSSAYPKSVPAAVETQQQYQLPNGMYSRDRQLLHNAIIRKEFLGKTPVEQPTVYFMGGGPASGKGRLITSSKVVGAGEHAVMVNPDHVKAQLPEYREKVAEKDATASLIVHEESSDISKEMMRYAGAHGYDCVIDTVGDSGIEKLARKIADLRANGQRIIGHYATVPVSVALARAETRGRKTGRFVSPAVVKELHAQVSRVWPELVRRGIFDHVTLWNTVAEPPTKIAEAEGSALTIHEPEAYHRFLEKGAASDERGDYPSGEGSPAGPVSFDPNAGGDGVPGDGPGGNAGVLLEPDLRAADRAVAFKAWFKDSKVVNPDGTPMVVYHGTSKEFAAFRPGRNWFSTSPGIANIYATNDGKDTDGARILPLYIAMTHPKVFDNTLESLSAWANTTDESYQQEGYDGVIIHSDNGTYSGYPFTPHQIKSASGNVGTFDPADPDITKSRIKAHERLNPSGSVSNVVEHEDKRTKKPDEAARPHKPTESELSARDGLAALLKDIAKPDGGFTYAPITDESPTQGYAVSIHKERERVAPVPDVTPAAIFHYTDDNWDLLKEEGNFIGAWHNPKNDQVYLDVSLVVDSREEAAQLARDHDQISYFDFQAGESVDVAPTGDSHDGQAKILPGGQQEGSPDAGADLRAVHEADGQRADAGGKSGSRSPVREEDRRLTKSFTLDSTTTFQGLPIAIENPRGSVRSGTGPDGTTWSVTMTFPYGYVMQTEGVDGEGVDCFLGDNPEALKAYVIHALAAPHFVDYDEDKVMLGFDSAEHAMMAFLENYSDTRFYGGMHQMPMEEFTEKVLASAGEIIKSHVKQHQRASKRGRVGVVHEYQRQGKPAGSFEIRERKAGDGMNYVIMVGGKMIGHLGGFPQGEKFHLYNTEVSDTSLHGTGLYQVALQHVADQYPNGLYVYSWESSKALQLAIKKMSTYHYDAEKEALYVRPSPAPALVYPHDPEAWIGVDFDGTLSQDIGEYDAHGFAKPGPPVPLMLERVKRWIAEKRNVKLLSARAADAANVQIVQDWLHEHGLPSLPVTSVKDSKMIALYDDRAVTVERNTGRLYHEVNEDYNGRIGRHRPVDIEKGTS